MKKTIRELIGEAIGEASMCWSETPAGVFDSGRASSIIDTLLMDIRTNVERAINREGIDSRLNRPDFELAEILIPTD